MKEPSESLQKEIEAYIGKNQPKIYWDYRDELSDSQIVKLVSNPEDLGEIESEISDLNREHGWDLEKEAVKEVESHFKDQLIVELGKKWKKRFKSWIGEAGLIYVDTNMKGLIKNTPDQVFFYDTGLEFSGYGNSASQYRLDRYKIKKAFSIPDSRHDKATDEMLLNAGYGGRLVVYFNYGIDDFLDLLQCKEANTIKFTNACIAIIDTCNGSGHDGYIPKHTFKLPFIRENLFYERSVHYNFTYEVCGMSGDWCDSTGVELLKEDQPAGIMEVSPLNAHIEQQTMYDETFRAGKCTFGDMHINRHRNVVYSNNFPCGNTCQDCRTFWID